MRINNILSVGSGSNQFFKGSKSISGTIKEKSIPLSCSILLCERVSGNIAQRVRSEPNGKYKFTNISEHFSYLVIAFHPELKFNAVIQDNVVPK